MIKYYTRACNFYYGKLSRKLVKKKKTLPLCGNNSTSFDKLEIFKKNKKKISSKIVDLNNINSLPKLLKIKIKQDIKKITSKRKFLNKKNHILMGILNMTPDSFSDGGKFNERKKAFNQISKMIKSGANIIDIGGESTRPGSKIIPSKIEWQRVAGVFKKFKKKFPKTLLSIDTRKSLVVKNAIKNKVDIINDVSCFKFDREIFKVIQNKNLWKIIHHMQGTPQTMQINPKYKHVLLDIYDFFENKIKYLKKIGIKHSNIIVDPGIGFGKNLKHNINLISNISIFHSLGFPILVGNSKKKFIKEISGKNDTKNRIGGTVASSIYLMMQGVQILRVHDVNVLIQGSKVFKIPINQ